MAKTLETRTIAILWLAYGVVYLCRQNNAIWSFELERQGILSATQIGWVLASFKISYGIGQLVAGQWSERVSPRRLLAGGLFASAAMSVVFGLSHGFSMFFLAWAGNGIAQSFGWTPTMRISRNRIGEARLGRAVAWIGSGYSVTAALAYALSAYAATHLGWRYVLFLPAGILCVIASWFLWVTREPDWDRSQENRKVAPSAKFPWKVTLGNPHLWLLGLALFAIDTVRYGLTDWGISLAMAHSQKGLTENALQFGILPLGGFVGALGTGWLSDRFFPQRREWIIAGMSLMLGVWIFLYARWLGAQSYLTIPALAMLGVCLAGTQTLLVGVAPMEAAREGQVAAAVGLVNMCGYLGAFLGDILVGVLKTANGWTAVIQFWICLCVVAAAACVMLLMLRFQHVARGS